MPHDPLQIERTRGAMAVDDVRPACPAGRPPASTGPVLESPRSSGPVRVEDELWETGRGDGSGVYLAGDPARRAKIGDFGLGGIAPGGSATAVRRAQLASAAPDMAGALAAIVDELERDDDLPQALVEAYEAGLYALKKAGVTRGR